MGPVGDQKAYRKILDQVSEGEARDGCLVIGKT